MSKHPIEWHESGYVNSSAHYQARVDLAKRQLSDLLYQQAKSEFRKIQIDEAKRRGMDGFDEERFMKKERAVYMEKIRETFFGELKMEELL